MSEQTDVGRMGRGASDSAGIMDVGCTCGLATARRTLYSKSKSILIADSDDALFSRTKFKIHEFAHWSTTYRITRVDSASLAFSVYFIIIIIM